MFCPKCGKYLSNISGDYCPQCGCSLQKARESFPTDLSVGNPEDNHTVQTNSSNNRASFGINLRPAMFAIAIVVGAVATYLFVASQEHGPMGYPNDMWEWYNYSGGSNICILLFVVAFIAAVIGFCVKPNKK